MDDVWSRGPCDVKSVHQSLGRGISLNTVQSTMDRLFRKDLLAREKLGHAFVYSAAVSREEYGTALAHEVLRSIIGPNREQLLSAFVDLAERAAGEENLARLEKLLAERRKRR
jgi:predicted transcriptional regulator